MRDRRTCPRPSDTWNQSGGNSSVRYEVERNVSLPSSVWYEESSWLDFVRLVRSRAKGEHVLVRLVRGIKHVGHRPSSTKSHERRACPHLSGTRNQASGTTSIRYKVARKEGLYSSVQYEDSSKQDYVLPVRSRAKAQHVLIHLVRAIKQAGLRPSGTKSRERRACPRPSGTRNQARGTSSIRYKVT